MIPTIREMNRTLDHMKQVYKFTDDAQISFYDLVRQGCSDALTVTEIDKDTGVRVTLEHDFLRIPKDDKDERSLSSVSYEC